MARKRHEQSTDIAPVPMSVELREKCGEVPAHVEKNLPAQILHRAAVMMKDDRRRFVAASKADGENTIPKLGIAAAAGGPDIEPLVEAADALEDFASESHVRAGADLIRGNAARQLALEPCAVEHASPVTAIETPAGFEEVLRFRFEVSRKHESGHGHHLRIGKGRPYTRDPRRMDFDVVVGERDDFARALSYAGIARDVESAARLEHVANPRRFSNDFASVV